jgi:hypothetical protein
MPPRIGTPELLLLDTMIEATPMLMASAMFPENMERAADNKNIASALRLTRSAVL